MTLHQILHWLATRPRARALVRDFEQPRTVSQLARNLGVERDSCGYLLRTLLKHGVVRCLNHEERRSRVFDLTAKGRAVQQVLRDREQLPGMTPVPEVDWQLYGQICYRQRTIVLTVLDRPLQPAAIKRHARRRDRQIQMSANNVRDVIRFLCAHNIVRRIYQRGTAHPHYELTETGRQLQTLLVQAESP